jgi:O-methyltransferase involved in polyketide biosynthesis
LATQLTAAGFESGRVSAWAAEGLLVYLSHDDAARLLTDVTSLSAPESRLSFDHDLPGQARDMAGMEEIAAMWRGGLGEDPSTWLHERGWNVESIARSTLARVCGRELLDQTGGFFTATRQR